jgi:hypothetical protein
VFCLVTDMEAQEQRATGAQDAAKLGERCGEICRGQIADATERGGGSQRLVGEAKSQNVAGAKWDARIELSGVMQHIRREVGAADAHAPVVQVSRHVSGAASDVTDHTQATCHLGELVEELPV